MEEKKNIATGLPLCQNYKVLRIIIYFMVVVECERISWKWKWQTQNNRPHWLIRKCHKQIYTQIQAFGVCKRAQSAKFCAYINWQFLVSVNDNLLGYFVGWMQSSRNLAWKDRHMCTTLNIEKTVNPMQTNDRTHSSLCVRQRRRQGNKKKNISPAHTR